LDTTQSATTIISLPKPANKRLRYINSFSGFLP
jgi:hypothetical protein